MIGSVCVGCTNQIATIAGCVIIMLKLESEVWRGKNTAPDEDFLLKTELSRRLYREVRDLPVIDYHNHLCLGDLQRNRQYKNLYEIWMEPDPYKHRLMRICGVPEDYITGDKSDYEKFLKWCEIFPDLVGTPVFDWARLELDRVFGIDLLPSRETADEIWQRANACLQEPGFRACELVKSFGVEYAAPCVSVCDDLQVFDEITWLAPSLRGDDITAPTPDFAEKLAAITGKTITSLKDYRESLEIRIRELARVGCRFSDHALDSGFTYIEDDGENERRFQKLLAGAVLSREDSTALACEILRMVSQLYARQDFTMQLHIGAKRETSTRLRKLAGPAGGYAGIGNSADIDSLTAFLDDLEKNDALPSVLLFTLNPTDNAMFATLSGSYSSDTGKPVIRQGPAWWWCDHMDGIREMLDKYSVYSVLSTFVGMTTDSRSILSFARHEYFRRVLCKWIGEKAERGEVPDDFELWVPIVRKICYENAKKQIGGRP